MRGSWIEPDWPAPPALRALSTTRSGGFSRGPYRSFNLGTHCGDDPAAVGRNREALRSMLPAEPNWLHQVHGAEVLEHRVTEPAATGTSLPGADFAAGPAADAQVARLPGRVCVILAADCLPVLLCSLDGTVVAAAHAGWRGLAAGVLENTVQNMRHDPSELLAWLGPAIGPDAYPVGDDVRQAFATEEAEGAAAFRVDTCRSDLPRWRFDLNAMARHCLKRAGVTALWGGHWCTASDEDRFFSYRRDGVCGRMASLVWLEGAG